uniref:U64-Liphistoxin-Lsp1a_1 n=2 Tax=Liphistius TaxID=62150 RepID=A0A4Q8K339_9ARAC
MLLLWHFLVWFHMLKDLQLTKVACLCISPAVQLINRPLPCKFNNLLCLSLLLDTLPLCRDFKSGQCKRQQCRYVHLLEDYVEVVDGKVTVCRDAVKGKCSRPLCKYYHIPLSAPFMNSVL